MNILNGCRVIVSDECKGKPRMILRDDICTPQFTADYNKWLLEFFGREPDPIFFMPEPYDLTGRSQVMLVSNRTFGQIKHLFEKRDNVISTPINQRP